MLHSSAQRTKRCPRRSNSRSSSSSTRLLGSGQNGSPCGVPSTLGLTSPFSITPVKAHHHLPICDTMSCIHRAVVSLLTTFDGRYPVTHCGNHTSPCGFV